MLSSVVESPSEPEISAEINALAARYPLVDIPVTAAGHTWTVTAVQDQDALIREVKTTADLEHFPYGLMLWASAVGLAERLAQEPDLIRGRRVLEIGAGIGFAGMVARWLGADLTQTDYQTDALALCRHNATQNGVTNITWEIADWRNLPPTLRDFDLVIGADVLYERTLHPALAEIFPRLLAPGGQILLSDPIRPQALEFLEQLEKTRAWFLRLEGMRVPWENGMKDIAFAFLQRK
jgi:predicted nicotinamide N-methyase